MRLLLAVALATCGLAIAPSAGWPARAVPGACPPICDAIPDSAWIAPTSIPLYPVYRGPAWPDWRSRRRPRGSASRRCATARRLPTTPVPTP